jgi:uncharacterized protein YndB with AHSA1/START domain
MPSFSDSAVTGAPPEEVWKLLYDPARFPEWWAGIAAVETEPPRGDGPLRFAYTSEDEPDAVFPQLMEASHDDRRIVVSCLIFDFRFEWRLEALGDGASTRIDVLVDVPEAEAARLDTMRNGIGRSVARLAELAAGP